MKKCIAVMLLGTGLLSAGTLAQSPLDDLRRRAEEALGKKRAPTDDRIAAGLKEALTVSTKKAVASTGRVDGFLKNAAIKILLPEKLRSAGKGMRLVGMGQQVDSLEVGMNRAAEQAAPAARKLLPRSFIARWKTSASSSNTTSSCKIPSPDAWRRTRISVSTNMSSARRWMVSFM
jgi:hypothetical protein